MECACASLGYLEALPGCLLRILEARSLGYLSVYESTLEGRRVTNRFLDLCLDAALPDGLRQEERIGMPSQRLITCCLP